MVNIIQMIDARNSDMVSSIIQILPQDLPKYDDWQLML
jgi:hypothetical protein